MALPIKDVLLLDYFNGKPIHFRVPDYKLRIYGSDAELRIDRLFAGGWIRYSKPQETISLLPDKALSDFLKHHGESGQGSHAELVRRVVERIPEKDYAHGVPKIYLVTARGQTEIASRRAYILNANENYGLSEGEIGEAQAYLQGRGYPSTARDILLRAFQQKASLLILAGEWSKLRNLYYMLGSFYIRLKDVQQALSYLFLVFFIDMSGMGNKNHVVPYENLFPTQKGMILLMNELRSQLSLSEGETKTSFLSSLARLAPRLPFSYFSPQVMATILMERMAGKEWNGTRYIAEKNTPDPSSKAYHYIPYGRDDVASAGIPAVKKAAFKPKPVPPVFKMSSFVEPKPFISTEQRQKMEHEAKRRQAAKQSRPSRPMPKDTLTLLDKLKRWF
ncbi:MAG: hypothetical protein SPI25_06705 [Dialister sp.]|nr:hypothetical protein [Dialister sp.]